MTTEQSPLLGDRSNDIYDRFSRGQKRVILAIVSLTGLIPMLANGCIVPSAVQMSKDLHVTPAAVSLAVSLPVIANAFGDMFWSAYSSYYGRRNVYISATPFTILGSLVIATSTGLSSLLCGRFIQMFGCFASFALGAAAIRDVYRLEERGTAMGTFYGASMIGLAVAPPLGGIVAQYLSWRVFQAAVGVLSVIQFLLLVTYFPETAHPGTRGVDKAQGPGKRLVWINPFRCLSFLRSPNIMAITLADTFALLTDYALLVPIAFTVGSKYGITSEFLVGLLLLPDGVGNFIGSPIAGRMSDWAVRKAKEERQGVWVPEDRLRAVWIGGLVLLPVSVLSIGFTATYVDGVVGLVICLVCLFFNGAGVYMVLSPVGAYIVDVMPSRSAEVMAAVSASRSLFIAPISSLIIPCVQTIGVAATNGIVATLVLIGYGLVWLTIRYGKEMRAYVDVGYPNFEVMANMMDARTQADKSLRAVEELLGVQIKYVDLTIQFIGASKLPRMEVIGTTDPFFHASLDGKVSYISSVKQNSTSPVWNEVWQVKNVPTTAMLSVVIRDKDHASLTDNYIGKFETTIYPGAKEAEIHAPMHIHTRGTFWLNIVSSPRQDGDPVLFPYLFDGPVRYSRHSSPTVGALTKLRDTRLYSTWKVYIKGVKPVFGDRVQEWNRSYKAAQAIFQGPTSVAVRAGIHAGHRMLYARSGSNEFGVIRSREDVFSLFRGGVRRSSIDGTMSYVHRIKPAVYTYIIATDDDTLRFSETGAAFFVDFVSKHALHSDCARAVRYSGEFHPRPVCGWARFSDGMEDGEVEWEIVVDNNSGTYSPDPALLPMVKTVVETNFAGIKVVALRHDDPELKASTDACRAYAVNKLLEPRATEGEETLTAAAILP